MVAKDDLSLSWAVLSRGLSTSGRSGAADVHSLRQRLQYNAVSFCQLDEFFDLVVGLFGVDVK